MQFESLLFTFCLQLVIQCQGRRGVVFADGQDIPPEHCGRGHQRLCLCSRNWMSLWILAVMLA